MASTAGRQLTEAHRLAQLDIGMNTAALMMSAFPLLDPEDLDGSFPGWLQVVTPLIQQQRRQSAQLAGTYLQAFRAVELGADADPFEPVLASDAPIEQIATSMLVTSIVSIRSNLARAVDVTRAIDIATAGNAGSGMRIALNGGRETVTETIRADHRARGYERVTSGNACDFCSMLADRGAVYSEDAADFEAHDHCSCAAEPVYL